MENINGVFSARCNVILLQAWQLSLIKQLLLNSYITSKLTILVKHLIKLLARGLTLSLERSLLYRVKWCVLAAGKETINSSKVLPPNISKKLTIWKYCPFENCSG